MEVKPLQLHQGKKKIVNVVLLETIKEIHAEMQIQKFGAVGRNAYINIQVPFATLLVSI
jgi:hypothetical protein